MTAFRLPTFALALLLAGPVSAQTAAPEPLERVRTARGEATVESVNQQTREVVLRGADGRLAHVTAGPDVRNLAQLRAGDRVVIEFRESLALAIAPPGAAPPPEGIVVEGRAEPGQRPAAVAGEAVRLRVRIIAFNPEDGRVTFQAPAGMRSTIIRDPAVRAFAAGLRPGDEVDIVWAEAVAIRVEPARRR